VAGVETRHRSAWFAHPSVRSVVVLPSAWHHEGTLMPPEQTHPELAVERDVEVPTPPSERLSEYGEHVVRVRPAGGSG
jgi:hypothetical protein